MTSPDFDYIEQRMRAATAALNEAMESALQEMLRFQRANRPTEEEHRAFQEAALRGDLGDDMRTLARLVEAGEDDWDRIYSGESPNAGLLRGHLDRMVEEHRDEIVRAIEEDDDFDPTNPEPRPNR
ncbi:hypothetical protein GCM10022225_44010 [Plantactinospora mayteni]|uniref:Uncharacterized protein n=1 Tax=Plantactinospora mayteni TaxID=566021 RepID=A0ABQ4ERU8_9ACTN|nr:hypothetical protein [Plantactinospora mayteni]GIG97389.1 hypothetical protein Pma05_39620 [Plantactinospora mayteni]